MAQSSVADSDVLDLYLKEALESSIGVETTSVNMENDSILNRQADLSHLESNDDLKLCHQLIKNVSFSGAIIAQSSYAASDVLELYCDETLESSDGEETTSVNIENDSILNRQVDSSHLESNPKLILSHHLIKNVSFSGGIMASLESDKGTTSVNTENDTSFSGGIMASLESDKETTSVNTENDTPLNRQVQVNRINDSDMTEQTSRPYQNIYICRSPTTPRRTSSKRFRYQPNPHLLLQCQNYADMLSIYRFPTPKFKPCATSRTKRFGDSHASQPIRRSVG